jgi:D-3-phosphoglycerate dehydrogenase
MKKEKILISTSSFAKYDKKPLKMLEEAGFIIEMNPFGKKLSEDEIRDLVKDVDFLIAGTEPLTRSVLASAKKLKLISRCGTGLDNVDLVASKEFNINVYNTPGCPTDAVAELAIGLILDLIRGISEMDRDLRGGAWKKKMGFLLRGKHVGIIGFGRIGQRVAELLLAFGTEVGYYDIFKIQHSLHCKSLDFKSLLSWADIISIHSSVSTPVKQIIGEAEFKLMKQGSYIINTARGGLIDKKALYKFLKDGYISGAALDVFEKEPYKGELTKLDNVVLTPHVGSYAKEARIRMEIDAVKNLLSYWEKVERNRNV